MRYASGLLTVPKRLLKGNENLNTKLQLEPPVAESLAGNGKYRLVPPSSPYPKKVRPPAKADSRKEKSSKEVEPFAPVYSPERGGD